MSFKKAAKEILKMFNRKYRLIDEQMDFYGHTVYRIKALKDIPEFKIKKGDTGGFVESERNLSHAGKSWVTDCAIVYGKARVKDDAWVGFGALVRDNARISGNAVVHDFAIIGGNKRINGNIMVSGNRLWGSQARQAFKRTGPQ